MTSALVVYESLFGDAHRIAHAVADGLAERLPAVVMDAREAPEQLGPEVAFLVVGGPNHQFGMPRQRSREEAQVSLGAQLVATDVGLREWLGAVHEGHGLPAAVFDTRLVHPAFLKYVDHAAGQEEKLLRARGFDVITPAEHFYVVDATGPLRDGEVERARAWGRTLGALVAHHAALG